MEASMWLHPGIRPGRAAFLIPALVALGGCGGNVSVESEPPVSEDEGMRQAVIETMCDTDAFQNLAITLSTRAERSDESMWIVVSAPDLPNSQVHDCQRLVEDKALGPVVALLVNRGRVAGAAPFDSGVVVADIVNHDSVDSYGWLRIEPGMNCLWLQGETAQDTGWVAVVYQPSGDCASDSVPPANAPRWVVARHRLQDGTNTYPSTGRWLWDADNKRQAIGIRCGDAWCEIGPPEFVSTANLVDSASVPGYYDEQFLSVWDDQQKRLRLSRLWGRITPGDSVHAEESGTPSTVPYHNRHVATMTFSWAEHTPPPAALDYYRTKFRLNPQNTEHKIHLSRTFPGGTRLLTATANGWATSSRVDPSNHTHSGSGTVRWAWYEGDEGTWFACEGGCCKKTDLN